MYDEPEILREYRVNIVPASEAAPVGPKDFGLRTKFGGVPDEVQPGSPSKMACRRCGGQMRFVAQIDSFEFMGDNNPNRKDHADVHFMFGDVGMIYVWFCFDCLEPIATMDCY